MKKYVVPVMTLHKLEPCGILQSSFEKKSEKPFEEDDAPMNTERYQEDSSFDSENLYD